MPRRRAQTAKASAVRAELMAGRSSLVQAGASPWSTSMATSTAWWRWTTWCATWAARPTR